MYGMVFDEVNNIDALTSMSGTTSARFEK